MKWSIRIKKWIKTIGHYEFLGRTISIYNTIENPLFLAKEVAEWIEHTNSRMMLKTIDENEKVVNNVYTLGGSQETWFLTEDGLYEVFMQSRKPIAKEFKKKIKEILKEIRKTGSFNKELSYEDKIEIATLITKCKNVKSVEALITLFEIDKPIKKIIKSNNNASGYLSDIDEWELTQVSTKKVYNDYCSYCKDNRSVPLSLSEFSKEVRKQTGAIVKRKRINGELTGFYVLP